MRRYLSLALAAGLLSTGCLAAAAAGAAGAAAAAAAAAAEEAEMVEYEGERMTRAEAQRKEELKKKLSAKRPAKRKGFV